MNEGRTSAAGVGSTPVLKFDDTRFCRMLLSPCLPEPQKRTFEQGLDCVGRSFQNFCHFPSPSFQLPPGVQPATFLATGVKSTCRSLTFHQAKKQASSLLRAYRNATFRAVDQQSHKTGGGAIATGPDVSD
jgi:hypothetical protein